MLTSFGELRYKEVINVKTGQRLGYVSDIEFNSEDGKITALVLPGASKLGGILGREDDLVLPWESISRIGEDIIIVDSELKEMRSTQKAKALF